MSRLAEFKDFIIDEIGDDWLREISEEQLEYFIEWAARCQTFRLSKKHPEWLRGNTGDAFRGFARGMKLMRERVENLERQIVMLETRAVSAETSLREIYK